MFSEIFRNYKFQQILMKFGMKYWTDSGASFSKKLLLNDSLYPCFTFALRKSIDTSSNTTLWKFRWRVVIPINAVDGASSEHTQSSITNTWNCALGGIHCSRHKANNEWTNDFYCHHNRWRHKRFPNAKSVRNSQTSESTTIKLEMTHAKRNSSFVTIYSCHSNASLHSELCDWITSHCNEERETQFISINWRAQVYVWRRYIYA